MHFSIADNYIRQERSKIHDNDDQVECIPRGTRVLMFHNQPKQTCGKLYQAWRGYFVVKRRIDKDTYIVFPEQQSRKELIVHRSRLRPLLSPAVEESSNTDMSAESVVPESEPEEAQPTNESTTSPEIVVEPRRSDRIRNRKPYHKFY